MIGFLRGIQRHAKQVAQQKTSDVFVSSNSSRVKKSWWTSTLQIDHYQNRHIQVGAQWMQGPSEGEPEPGSYAEELSKNIVVNGTPKGPQEVPPKVPGAIDPNKPNFKE